MLPLLAVLLALTPHQARSRPEGSSITLEGHVTVPSGIFASFMGDNGFVLGDHITGIYVATDNRGYRSMGSAVEVTGTLADNGHGMLILRARAIRPQKGRSLFKPWPQERAALGEFYEGKIVRTEGEVLRLTSDLPYGHKLFLRHAGGELQVFLPPGTRPAEALLAPGRRLQVTGFCAQYDKVYEIVVRSAKDVIAP